MPRRARKEQSGEYKPLHQTRSVQKKVAAKSKIEQSKEYENRRITRSQTNALAKQTSVPVNPPAEILSVTRQRQQRSAPVHSQPTHNNKRSINQGKRGTTTKQQQKKPSRTKTGAAEGANINPFTLSSHIYPQHYQEIFSDQLHPGISFTSVRAERHSSPSNDTSSITSFSIPFPDEFYRSFGYSPPVSEMSSSHGSLSRSTAVNSNRGKKIRAAKPGTPGFIKLLGNRNININPKEDGFMRSLKKIVLKPRHGKSVLKDDELWSNDIDKCKITNEAVFQRTTMMNFFDRNNLGDSLNYTCEELWNSDRVQSMMANPNEPMEPRLPKPKPDLAVAFQTSMLLPADVELSSLVISDLIGYICPEGDDEKRGNRACHFFAVETKGCRAAMDGREAQMQNLNSAATALHNMYMIMREANDTATLLQKVRFFSITASPESFEVRVHRPYKLSNRTWIDESYPIGYTFQSMVRYAGHEYTGHKVTNLVRNILFEYGVKMLLPILKGSLIKIVEKRKGSISYSIPTGNIDLDLQNSFDGTTVSETTDSQQFFNNPEVEASASRSPLLQQPAHESDKQKSKKRGHDGDQSFNSNLSNQRMRLENMGAS